MLIRLYFDGFDNAQKPDDSVGVFWRAKLVDPLACNIVNQDAGIGAICFKSGEGFRIRAQGTYAWCVCKEGTVEVSTEFGDTCVEPRDKEPICQSGGDSGGFGSGNGSDSSNTVGNPIHLPSGKKAQIETDYQVGRLILSRAYTPMYSFRGNGLGRAWRFAGIPDVRLKFQLINNVISWLLFRTTKASVVGRHGRELTPLVTFGKQMLM